MITPTITIRTEAPRSLGRELARRLRRAGLRLGLTPREIAGIAVHVVDDDAIAALNRTHMGKRGPTDVLSFPTGERDLGEWDDYEGPASDAPPVLLGDIVLSWPAVGRQARRRDAAGLVDEATVLVIHGLAHLLGHDHGDRREGRAMHRVELRALAAVRVPDIARPYGLRRGA
ncbi:MAG: rRNA maturation RNase YbeY [Nannocystaceae bacterium]